MLVSCSNETQYNSILIDNISSSSVTIAIISSSDSDKIDTTADVSTYAIDIKNIKSQGQYTFSISNGDYTIWYNYPDVWGVLTSNGETKIFKLQDKDLSITINKREWSQK